MLETSKKFSDVSVCFYGPVNKQGADCRQANADYSYLCVPIKIID